MMERHQIIEAMTNLKLYGMRASFDEIAGKGLVRREELYPLLASLIRAELTHRQSRSINYRISGAKFPVLKDIDDFVFADTPVDEGLVRELSNGDFVEAKRNLILIGGTGTGKTHLAIAVAAAVIRARARGRFFNLVDLVNQLEQEKAAGRSGRLVETLLRHDLIIIDELGYLPKAWTDDPPRMAAAHVPSGTAFVTKPSLARQMIDCAIDADVPFSWVAADTVYGVGDVEMGLRRVGKGYVLGVASSHHFGSWGDKPPVAGTAEEIAKGLDASDWKRLSTGEGTKGPRLHDWAYCELADIDAGEYDETRSGLWTRGLLIRRNIADSDLAFFTTWAPAGTNIETLVKIEGHRWAIEDSFETAKNELGLDHNETRSWHGWHRHVALVMLAFAMTAAIRHHANLSTPPKTKAWIKRQLQQS